MEVKEYISEQTNFVVYPIDCYYNIYGKDDKRYLIKVFLNIYKNQYKCKIVTIKNVLETPEALSGYDYYNDYYILSNDSKVIINNDYHMNDNFCQIVDDELNDTKKNYFIMEEYKFISKYNEFIAKLNKLLEYGYTLNQIKFLFDEFTKDVIEIL